MRTEEVTSSIRETMREVLSGARDLLDSLGKESSRRYGEGVDRLRSNIDRASESLGDYGRAKTNRLRDAARYADDTVHEYAWTSSGAAFVLGAVTGAVLTVVLLRR